MFIEAAVFEVSTPSLGTGIEIAHAYLRPRLGLPAIPVIALYQKDYWPNNLSTMIRGITRDEVSNFMLKVYDVGKAALDELQGVHKVENGFYWFKEINTVYYDPDLTSIEKMQDALKEAGTYVGTLGTEK